MPITPPQCARPHHRPEMEDLDGRGDDVAVRPGELISECHHGPARRVPAGRWLAAARAATSQADHPPGELLHHELGDMAAAVAADVHDQRVPGHLAAQIAVEVGPAFADHVRNVQVTDPVAAQSRTRCRRDATQSW